MYKVYVIDSKMYYTGYALVAAVILFISIV